MPNFDTRPWNLVKPLSALAIVVAAPACGPGSVDGEDGRETTTNNTVDPDYTDYYSDWADDYDDGWDAYYDPCNYCAPDQICEGDECVDPGCEDSLDCADGLACIDSMCVPIPESLGCGSWPTVAIDVPPLPEVLDLSFVDVDDDGARELVMLTATGVSVLEQDLSLVESTWAQPGVFSRVSALRVDDGDILDLAFTDPASPVLRTLIGAGDGSFGAEADETVEALVDPVAMDLDGDGQDELVALVGGVPSVVTAIGEAALVSEQLSNSAFQQLLSGDNDGNGQLDLLIAGDVADPLGLTASWILREGLTWGPGPYSAAAPDFGGAWRWGAYDLDGDGRDDAFAAAPALGGLVMHSWIGDVPWVSTLPQAAPAWMIGAEFDGTNGEELLLGTPTPTLVQRLNTDPIRCSYPLEGVPVGGTRAAAGDFDGDGIDELAVLVDGVVELRVSDFM